MRTLLKTILKPAYQFVAKRNYREYSLLLNKYGKERRFHPRVIKFLNYEIEVVDAASFLGQYKEIFLQESYKFGFDGADPLIFDCGANIGMSCLFFRRMYPDARIKAFEADPSIFEVLKRNIGKNTDGQNFEFINKAVWTNDTGIVFFQDGADGGKVQQGNKEAPGIRVGSLRLKQLIENEKPDFLKMDIEGAETEVLLDCDRALSNVEAMFVEYHSTPGTDQRLAQLLQLLSDNGFRYFAQSPYELNVPFEQSWKDLDFDLQLNIFCYRSRGK